MAMQVRILGSSSSGNCALLRTAGACVLIDAGFSGKRIAELLEEAGVVVSALDAVFITHEHTDHVCGLAGLRRYGVPVCFANTATVAGLPTPVRTGLPWRTFETGSTFVFRDLEVSAFLLPHDAMEPVGFVFATSSEPGADDKPRRRVGWATDLGYVPESVRLQVRECDLLVLEANHDLNLLEQDTKRPWSVKQRIRGRHGHLSNQAAREFLASERTAAWRQVLLGHLSKDCNDPALVRSIFDAGAAIPGIRNYALDVLDPRAGIGPWIEV